MNEMTDGKTTDSHPGMMGDGTEEQNLGQPGHPGARITREEVEAAFDDGAGPHARDAEPLHQHKAHDQLAGHERKGRGSPGSPDRREPRRGLPGQRSAEPQAHHLSTFITLLPLREKVSATPTDEGSRWPISPGSVGGLAEMGGGSTPHPPRSRGRPSPAARGEGLTQARQRHCRPTRCGLDGPSAGS